MVITIDGPAGAGKSTIARRLAERLGIDYLDTGAMYRAVAWAALQAGVPVDASDQVAALLENMELKVDGERVTVNGQDVSHEIRRPDVSRAVSAVADHLAVRAKLVEWQREYARNRSLVTEGRDQGTVVFPDADLKIFLTADDRERARRRVEQLRSMGIDADMEAVLQEQRDRDQRDANRSVGRLVRAPDAIDVCTDGKSVDEVVDEIVGYLEASQRSTETDPQAGETGR